MSFKPRTHTVRLYQGDYQQRVDQLEADLDAARKAAEKAVKSTAPRLLSEDPAEAEAARGAQLEAELDDLRAEAEASGDVLHVTLHALPRRQWGDLVKAHPPRTEGVSEEVKDADAKLGVNDETFGEALVPQSIESLSDANLSVDELLDAVSSAQWDLLYGTAFALNRAVGSDPKAPRRSQPSPSGAATES